MIWPAGSSEAVGYLNCFNYTASLDSRFLIFGKRIAIQHDSRPGIYMSPAVFQQCRANGYGAVHIAVEAKVANDPRINASLLWFNVCQMLHGSYFWRTGYGTARKTAAKGVKAGFILFEAAGNFCGQMHHVCVSRQHGYFSDLDASYL